MSIHVALHHRTHYRYDRRVALGPQVLRLKPAPHCRTRVLSYSLQVSPGKHFINWQQDPQSNYLARIVFPERTEELLVEVDLVAEMAVLNPFDFFLEPDAEHHPFRYDAALNHELEPFRSLEPATPRFQEYLQLCQPPGTPAGTEPAAKETRLRTIDFLVALNRRLCQDIRYLIRLEPGVQSPERTLELRSGSCRDSAWLLCQLLRHCGLAARFVSGYLIQLSPDVKSLDGPSGAERDFTDLHAWCEVYLPGAGWIGLDPTSGLLAGEGHLPLACAPDPTSAAPITGLVEECECDFSHAMHVTRIHESPRVTKPYTEEQWQCIESLGQWVDQDLERQDVRLTVGGEPTFVSMDDPDGAEWNTAALGPRKRVLADALLRRLKGAFAPGGLLHHGQGKWYPGEPLPRWAFTCYWRRDGMPLWERSDLIAALDQDYGHSEWLSARFIEMLASRLGVDGKWIMPAYEDPFYHLWMERRLPANVDPLKADLQDDAERARLARILESGLGRVVGHALPVQRASTSPSGWTSGPWFLRTEHLYLLPGDSPMGFRLPLDSLPWVRSADYPYVHPTDPSLPRPPLPSRAALWLAQVPGMQPARGTVAPAAALRPAVGDSAAWIVRTALCVEPRDGCLHVFMPPVAVLEDYLALVSAVEATATQLGSPVVLEGYPPPQDPRLQSLKVTPDPGVIEVNLQPSSTWNELVQCTTTLYEEARQARLVTEKFMLDGRHTGTGGGNHVVLGGNTPADSPFLRRPDLLRSLVTYWQHHPSLSFLFSGLFIGPTSQSPRVDEARHENLRELEIAFRQVPDAGAVPPWFVDRLFRNLLVDATGNTHRAEFCIDKLYSPDGGSGRLGLVEMRSFEMPPHARMSLAQQLLIRVLVARLWREPYARDLVRWGTELHDRWMLPHFVWGDLKDVTRDLQDHGYAVRPEWFAPHFEFRFPSIGDLQLEDIHLELRSALEPWHVLGEEGAPGGTARHVDSSLERLQLKVQGIIPGRHAVTVGGHRVPLHPTGTNGEAVAGVRYRAWQPPRCLHPTIGVHTPLVFDVVDLWNRRSLGGCTYHVFHPGGRDYQTFPVNAYEAESRRLARFFRQGHTPGLLDPPPHEISGEFPFTLDLRRA